VLVPARGFENYFSACTVDSTPRWPRRLRRGAKAGLTDATAWYFSSVEEAQVLVARFPMLDLADGTELPTFQSPHLQFGRGAAWSDPVQPFV
jgi:hypothetical protein